MIDDCKSRILGMITRDQTRMSNNHWARSPLVCSAVVTRPFFASAASEGNVTLLMGFTADLIEGPSSPSTTSCPPRHCLSSLQQCDGNDSTLAGNVTLEATSALLLNMCRILCTDKPKRNRSRQEELWVFTQIPTEIWNHCCIIRIRNTPKRC